jgi:hypothetical protein
MKTLKLTKIPSTITRDANSFNVDEYLSVKTCFHRGVQLYARFALGGWTKDGKGRIEHEGPMVSGPYLYASGLASVIDCHGGTGKESADRVAQGREFEIEEGQLVEVDGVTYRAKIQRRGSYAWVSFDKCDGPDTDPTALDIVKEIADPLRNLYRNSRVKPGAIAVTPEQFDAFCDVMLEHAKMKAGLEMISELTIDPHLRGDGHNKAETAIKIAKESLK